MAEYILFDNELIDRYVAREQIDLSKVNPIVFGLNGCSTIDISSFKGWIDQLSITTRAMSALEIERNFAIRIALYNLTQPSLAATPLP